MPDVNYVSLAMSVVAGLAVGFVWYGVLFGGLWQRLSGMTDKEMEALIHPGVSERLLLHVVGLIIAAFLLSYFVTAHNAVTFATGAIVGLFVWVVGAVVLVFSGVLSRKARHENVYVVALDLSHWLIALAVMAGVLAVLS